MPRPVLPARVWCSRRVAALALGAGLAGGCVTPREQPTGPADLPPALGAPASGDPGVSDTVVRSPGLPPRAADSTTHALGPAGDTLVVAQLMTFPAHAFAPSQVAPGAPTSAPMRLDVRVFARDTSPNVLRPIALALAACPVVLRIVRAGADGGAPAWRSDAAPPAAACPPVQRYSAADAHVTWPVPAVLGDSLPAGRYDVRYTVRLADGRTLDYSAGGVYLSADPAPPGRDFAALRAHAESRVAGAAPRQLRTTVWLRNPTARSLQFEYGACALQQRLYRTAARTGRPAWRSELRQPPGTNSAYGCPAVLLGSTLPPGDSLPFVLAVPLAEVFGDTLAAGRYYVAAELELLDDAAGVPNWRRPFTLAAGEVDLVRAADPLPPTRTVDGLRYAATTRVVGDTVRTLVVVTNPGAVARQAEVTRDCPVIAYAYRSAERRDAMPLAQPDWAPSRACYMTPHPFSLAPGAAWAFQHDVPAAALRARLGAGRVWFTAWVAGRPDVKLAAGDVVLP